MAVEPLTKRLQDPSGVVRVEAANAINRIEPGNKTGVPTILAALRDPDLGVRCYAVATAREPLQLDPTHSVPVLIEALTDKDSYVRRHAAIDLGLIGMSAKGAIPALEKATKDENESVREQATEALKLIRSSMKEASQK
jgi:HEAT repeat protein